MAETARIHAPDPGEADEARPLLQVVRDTVVDETHEDSMPNVGRTALIGYGVGFVVATVVITIGGTLGGMGAGPSFGLGAFVGVWGGGGFGFMMGGTVPLARHLDAQSAHSRHHGQGDSHGTAAR